MLMGSIICKALDILASFRLEEGFYCKVLPESGGPNVGFPIDVRLMHTCIQSSRISVEFHVAQAAVCIRNYHPYYERPGGQK